MSTLTWTLFGAFSHWLICDALTFSTSLLTFSKRSLPLIQLMRDENHLPCMTSSFAHTFIPSHNDGGLWWFESDIPINPYVLNAWSPTVGSWKVELCQKRCVVGGGLWGVVASSH